ncbi:MAG: hypothetical protein HYV02_08570 [Deltaproteobacteria bacterium]|nr:hypothetical protein [Deltaproteobacteria bacterium]
MTAPSTDDVQFAARFTPELCRPVADLIERFPKYLSPTDLFTIGTDIPQSLYISPTSPEKGHYYLQTLQKMKQQLDDVLDPAVLARRFDPAIAFFHQHLKEKKGIVVDCLGVSETVSVPDTNPVLPKSASPLTGVPVYLRAQFGLPIQDMAGFEQFTYHQIFYAQIVPTARDLIIIVPDIHYSKALAKDYLMLVDGLVQHGTHFSLIAAYETVPEELARVLQSMQRDTPGQNDLSLIRTARTQGVFKRVVDVLLQDDTLTATCRANYASIPLAQCVNSYAVRTVTDEVVFAVLGADPTCHWALDMQRADEQTALSEAMHMGETLDARLRAAGRFYEISAESSQFMAHTLVNTAKDTRRRNAPRIILVRVGAAHVSLMLHEIVKAKNLSVLGLLSVSWANTLKPWEKVFSNTYRTD